MGSLKFVRVGPDKRGTERIFLLCGQQALIKEKGRGGSIKIWFTS